MDVKVDDKGFQKLIETLKADMPAAVIGILGKTNARGVSDQTNASIGVRHELGIGVPVRSFLYMPLSTKFNGVMRNSGLFGKKVMQECMAAGSFRPIVEKMAVLGEAVVMEAFDSGGYGQWKPSNMTHKKVHQTLVETQQLRNSITSEVV